MKENYLNSNMLLNRFNGFLSVGYAKKKVQNSNSTSTEDFFYQRGYEVGYTNGFNDGVRKAMQEAKKMLMSYSDQLKSYEVGKFLIKTQNLTYPQIWQEIDKDGNLKIRIIPSKIEKELSIDELFTKFGKIPQMSSPQELSSRLTLDQQNSVHLNDRDSNINSLPQNVDTPNNKITLNIKKTSKNLDILKRANVVFSDEGESYNVLFFTGQEKTDFCQQFGICDVDKEKNNFNKQPNDPLGIANSKSPKRSPK